MRGNWKEGFALLRPLIRRSCFTRQRSDVMQVGYLRQIVKRSDNLERTKALQAIDRMRGPEGALGPLLFVRSALLFGQHGEFIQGEAKPASLAFSFP